MAGLAPQHNNPSQLGSNKPILVQLEEQYTKRVDDDVLKLVDSFADIIRVTEVRWVFHGRKNPNPYASI
jgi:hypothetical protein